ncbi:MAG: hypothetical protein ACLVBU_11310 [Hominisplanchenecus sp.]|uniref:hypothetical protein n=1 Tax=Hominisplanchenecus sp. TaxID=3038130 RepID=UPI003995F3D4
MAAPSDEQSEYFQMPVNIVENRLKVAECHTLRFGREGRKRNPKLANIREYYKNEDC